MIHGRYPPPSPDEFLARDPWSVAVYFAKFVCQGRVTVVSVVFSMHSILLRYDLVKIRRFGASGLGVCSCSSWLSMWKEVVCIAFRRMSRTFNKVSKRGWSVSAAAARNTSECVTCALAYLSR